MRELSRSYAHQSIFKSADPCSAWPGDLSLSKDGSSFGWFDSFKPDLLLCPGLPYYIMVSNWDDLPSKDSRRSTLMFTQRLFLRCFDKRISNEYVKSNCKWRLFVLGLLYEALDARVPVPIHNSHPATESRCKNFLTLHSGGAAERPLYVNARWMVLKRVPVHLLSRNLQAGWNLCLIALAVRCIGTRYFRLGATDGAICAMEPHPLCITKEHKWFTHGMSLPVALDSASSVHRFVPRLVSKHCGPTCYGSHVVDDE